MKPLSLVAASTLALGAAACGTKAPHARAALECPAAQGDLTRTSVSADRRTCIYSAGEGAEVTLQLVALKGGVDATLSGIETTLLASRRPPQAGSAKADEVAEADAAEAARVARQAEQDAGGDVRIAVGKDAQVVAEEGGETRVSLPGIHIVADDAAGTANVKVGPITVNAADDEATIRIRRDVRLRGEALNPEKRGIRASFLYAGEDLADGYRFVGYEAGGPKRGPITVAVVRSKSDRADGERIYSDVKRLVRKNGGV